MGVLDSVLEYTGWLIGLIGLLAWYWEHRQNARLEKSIEYHKRLAFKDSLSRGLATFSAIHGLDLARVSERISRDYLVDYLNATSVQDQSSLASLWRKISEDVAKDVEAQAKGAKLANPGFKETITFLFLVRYADTEAKQYIKDVLNRHPELQENIGRYYFAFTRMPPSLEELRSTFESCKKEQFESAIATLKGEELERVSRLFASEKWSHKLIERLRGYVTTRQLSYNSLVNNLIEAYPNPKLYVILKNEGKNETEEESIEKRRVVATKMKDLREQGKIDMVSSISSVHFARSGVIVDEFLRSLPKGIENNYVVFSAEIDPLTMRIETPDRLEGKPASFYGNLQRFSDVKKIYEALLIKLGIRPSEIIETADLGFLLDSAPQELLELLRHHSIEIMKEVSERTGLKVVQLTDLRELDEENTGVLAQSIVTLYGGKGSQARKYADQIVQEARNLHESLYGPLQ